MLKFLKGLSPGTRLKSMVVAGVEVELATFIHFETSTKQARCVTNDGNLFVANGSDIEAITFHTKDKAEKQ